MFAAYNYIMHKHQFFIVVALVAMTAAANAQTVSSPQQKHYLDLGALAGYNPHTKGIVYGGGLNYEYRPVKQWGFTAGFNYDFTKTDQSGIWSTAAPGVTSTKADYWGLGMYSASIGARRYIDRFFIGASLGLAYERSWAKMDDGVRTAVNDRYGFHQHYYVGYQIPLKHNQYLEIIGGAFGAGPLKVGGGLRYKIGL